jgi:hypothetical protein
MENVKRRKMSADAVKRFATRSAKASAKLERRELPAGYVRPAAVEQFLAERRQTA